ncbi:hypothetical protein BON30_13090 [Cystobacter ferrugineus]|uniref:Uncharacterized protein n=1 Tax=Cystobacter ferrugineus TaxID=83449 RepID=A0A1L9BCL1_9BACT|nr:hypothetical protein [Cystobacter ferrugineus]OJH40002.1 hypothetical protein BON30_13090 [Cystobacter ferrugineus]
MSPAQERLLARAHGLETLESAYDAWSESRREFLAEREHYQREFERLEQQGSFLVGAVRQASVQQGAPGEPAPAEAAPAGSALVAGEGPLHDFLGQAEQKLARAKEALAREQADSEQRYRSAFEEWRTTVSERVRRHLAAAPPRLRLLLRKVGTTRAILHVERVSGDTPVLLLYLFTGRIPSRYGFLFDDSTEDVSLPPAPLYAEEGVESHAVRPDPSTLEARLRSPGEVLPVKGFLPVFVPRPGGGEDFFRLLQRGPVMEVEVAEGGAFRAILSREESERFAGHLLRLNLQGQLVLEVEAG